MFKNQFKYFKSRCPTPNFESVLDFNSLIHQYSEKVIKRKPSVNIRTDLEKSGLKDASDWQIYELKDLRGLIFIVNPFTSKGQQYWTEKCLEEYTKKPNRLNLDPFNVLFPGEDWWEATQSKDRERAEKLLHKLRWATLGYHHNWDTKVYSESARGEFPSDLAELSRLLVEIVEGAEAGGAYQAEAAIVNFYHLDSTLSGHKDVSELNMNSPLLSISFGQSALFLIGGENLEDPATAMFIHSGDVVIMSGQARSCYHGVPRIVKTDEKPWADGSWELASCGTYLNSSRININVRQVLLPGEKEINV